MSRQDPGLQPERTALAWRRTELSLLVAAVVVSRLGATSLDGRLLWLMAAIPMSVVVVRSAGRSRKPDKPLTDGWPIAAVSGAVCVLAVLEMCGAIAS
ncbi:DUF202 domain-containing protein [Aeromicrobium sp. Root236]|uniref:DUF202 domain-containing protein n=1 Tax=Aeromicrobium sp. Root236 TaxID=1736498 RepID=UPI000B063EB4|nr:DUF202 domain-containing protein [Aeromicrobium sp. Root236]